MPGIVPNATNKSSTATPKSAVTEDSQADQHDPYWTIVWAVGCVAFIIFVFLLATVQYVRKLYNNPQGKRKLRKRREQKQKAREEKSIAELSRDPIPAQDFLKDLKKKKKKGTILWEFKALNKQAVEHSHEAAQLPENIGRNACSDVLPYDHCRVTLRRLPNEAPASDYINASYVDSYTKPRAYIATQGPSRRSVADFWKMVWQEDIHCIVMATNLFEHARHQCEKYWHNQHGKYGDIHVWLETADILADFTIRTFRVQKNTSNEERIIKQYQFSCWSDHECPNPGSVLEYRRRIRAFVRNKPGPLLVHCGTGAGRTGAFIALDAALERLTVEKTVDIFNYVQYLRTCRKHMVRNIQQYEFIYNTVAMFLQCGVTVINAKELPYVVQRLAVKDPHSKTNGFEREFKTLQTVVPKLSVGECAGGHRAENRRKSRDIMIQPPERARPYLITHDSNDSTDYINAVYVDGYRHGNAYIVSQWPLKSTVNDVWRLIYDYNIPTLVLLNDMPFTRNCPRFWPSILNQDAHYGPLTVELIQEEFTEHITSRVFKIKKRHPYLRVADQNLSTKECPGTLVSLQAMATNTEDTAKTVRIFQLRCWANNQKMPSSPSAFIELLTRVEDWQMNHCHGRIPTLVMSKNGVSRCGIFCSISITWDKLKTEGEVDIFRAVRTVKSNRTQLVENMVEYIYCYTFLVVLLELLNATHPHMIPVNVIMEDSTNLVNPTAVPPGGNSTNHTGDDNHVFKSQTTDPSHLALLVHHQNSPKVERKLVGMIINDGASVASSDQDSFHSTLEHAQNSLSAESVDKRPDERCENSSRNILEQKGRDLLNTLKSPKTGSPGRTIKIFATENSNKVNGYTNLGGPTASLFPGSPTKRRKESFQSDKSGASSYATCLDILDHSNPSTPLRSLRPLPPVIVIDQLSGQEGSRTQSSVPNKFPSCSELDKGNTVNAVNNCSHLSVFVTAPESPILRRSSTASVGSNGKVDTSHSNVKWKRDLALEIVGV